MQPTTIILFGITGDLAQKKILPALYDLFVQNKLPKQCQIVGFSRRAFAEHEIRTFVQNTLGDGDAERVSIFLKLITYVQGEFDTKESYAGIGRHLNTLDGSVLNGCSNKLFYLSVPPTLYETIARGLSQSGLSVPCIHSEGGDSYTRILVEKPFGKDLQTAQDLDRLFGELFEEEQIYRIDHYLAKDTLAGLLAKRTTDEKLKHVWSSEYIEKVEINLFEKAVVGSRGSFYDGVGALRDVGQNHMLQMLALVAMDEPATNSAQEIQQLRAKVLEKIRPYDPIKNTHTIKAQYEGYLSEPGVSADSQTETFFSLIVYVDTEKFSGVPCVLSGGKALDRNATEIIVHFKDGTHTRFDVHSSESMPAYEKILLDCILGDQTVFTSTAEVLAEWAFITPVVTAWFNTAPRVYRKFTSPESIVNGN